MTKLFWKQKHDPKRERVILKQIAKLEKEKLFQN